jgi:antitoxin component YwqK of YwqJK toxin-antitoxin module
MINYSITIFLLLILTDCSRKEIKDSQLIVISKSDSFEKGMVINGKKEGYWVSYDTNFSLRFDCVYENDSLNGPITMYVNNSIACVGEMKDNKRNGK